MNFLTIFCENVPNWVCYGLKFEPLSKTWSILLQINNISETFEESHYRASSECLQIKFKKQSFEVVFEVNELLLIKSEMSVLRPNEILFFV
jgi:hypothetical protein